LTGYSPLAKRYLSIRFCSLLTVRRLPLEPPTSRAHG